MRRFLGFKQTEQGVRAYGRVDQAAGLPSVARDGTTELSLTDSLPPELSDRDQAALAETAPLLAAAIRHEEIRMDFQNLVDRFSAFNRLKEDFFGVTQRFVDVIDELENLKKEKSELEAQAMLSEAVGADLRAYLSELEPKYEALVSESAQLHAQAERLRDVIAGLEAAKQKEHADHHATRDLLKLREGDLAEARTQIHALQDEISAGRRELDRLSSALAEREVEFEKLASALRASEEQGRILKTLLDESTFQTARLSRTVSELEPLTERLKSQIVTLQSAVESEREAKEKAAIERIEGLELLRGELRATTTKFEAATQRADTHEKMLQSSRNNYREKLEELRTVERNVIDLTMQLANMTRRAETAEADKTALHSRLDELETVARTFDQRLQELTNTLTEKESSLMLARDQIVFETSRLEESQRMARAERARYEADIVELTRLLDKERVDRTVLEGTLLSLRRRQIFQSEEAHQEEAHDGGVVVGVEGAKDEHALPAPSGESDAQSVVAELPLVVQSQDQQDATGHEASGDRETGAVILEFDRNGATSGAEAATVPDLAAEQRTHVEPVAS